MYILVGFVVGSGFDRFDFAKDTIHVDLLYRFIRFKMACVDMTSSKLGA